jgi:hypothetical protein
MEQNRRPKNKSALCQRSPKQPWTKNSIFNNYLGKTGYLSPCTNDSKRIIDLKPRSETLKLLQEKIGKTLKHVGIGNNFLNRTQIVQQI